MQSKPKTVQHMPLGGDFLPSAVQLLYGGKRMNSINIIHQEKMLARKRRNRTILWLRLCSGMREVATRPLKGIPLVLLCGVFVFIWNTRNMLVQPFHNSNPLLSTVCSYLIIVFIPMFFLLLLAGLLFLFGTPFRAKAIEASLLQIGLSNRYGHAPALISRKHVKNTSVSVLMFYSPAVGMERWEKQKSEVQDALNLHFVEPIKYGGRKASNRNIIVITATSGVAIRREDTLYDDEI